MKGKFNINDKVWPNHIMDAGVKKMMRAISSTTETNTLLLWMSVGTGDTSPNDTTRTGLVTEVGASTKYDVGTIGVNSVYPYDLELSVIIPANDITAGTVLKEVAIWWGPTGTKELFARATDSTGVTVVSGNVVTVKYELNII